VICWDLKNGIAGIDIFIKFGAAAQYKKETKILATEVEIEAYSV